MSGAAGHQQRDPDALEDMARAALASGTEEQALEALAPAAQASGSSRLWQWTGLLQRAIDDHGAALRSFEQAAALDPNDAGIAHGRARVALEAGVPATDLFLQALRLSPGAPDILLGFAAARLADGDGEAAVRDLERMLAAQPLWLAGHQQLAQLRAMLGRKADYAASLDAALAAQPAAQPLWVTLFDLAIKSDDFARLDVAVKRAGAAGVPEALTLPYAAIAASEGGETAQADALFARIPMGPSDPLGLWRVRHLLRTGRADQALAAIDAGLASPAASGFWPYASIAWRLTNDPRADWLEGDARLVRTADLPFALGELAALAARLRSLHVAKAEYLDQSVRGGTQTDGPLFSRIDPEIRTLRAKVVAAVETYVAALPAPDPAHPLLGRRRERPIRFSGSWSVRLRASGRHVSHVHPQGWISSAFYVALPPGLGGEGKAGWLTLGAPPDEVGVQLPPTRAIEPVAGRLALFPSWMWHGTVPFEDGERLTVAFDVRPPT
ncbi:hypothetical protein H8M03_10175 [Sphingomonas sabuli]|uniref:Uncharacterized protein n=1 Tax=Sphingomonas sabuli TaxID=2764186 RepID=A0A7G9L174_9SPHN|nr:putative 2OG-Fe(II) oxygenase [Sphingomonas sabuli]QNM82373.1 hypothetical protein H8M03_10175 [Sphingomonas sabuli]